MKVTGCLGNPTCPVAKRSWRRVRERDVREVGASPPGMAVGSDRFTAAGWYRLRKVAEGVAPRTRIVPEVTAGRLLSGLPSAAQDNPTVAATR
jgi:hypothetical protein